MFVISIGIDHFGELRGRCLAAWVSLKHQDQLLCKKPNHKMHSVKGIVYSIGKQSTLEGFSGIQGLS